MSEFIWLLPAFPLLGFALNGAFGRHFSRLWVALVGVGVVFASFIVAILALFHLLGLPAEERAVHAVLYNWITVGGFSIDVSFLLDPLSAVMILVVTGVGSLIHLYAARYMIHEEVERHSGGASVLPHGSIWHERDADYARFFTAMNLFVFAMLVLVLADNYLLMFLGWEGVGLCSYLLIGYYFNRDQIAVGTDERFLSPRSSATKAFVVNRVGDFGFTLGLILMFWTFGSLSFDVVFEQAPRLFAVGAPVVTVMTLLLFLGATGKSAQVPLYIWLPDAMAGPTPVSALIHAATMVTAGVYMVARSQVLYALAPLTLSLVAVIGVLSAFLAASIALVQNDLKRVLAYSTISQLGYMFFALGVGAYAAAIFHLMTHAFFKALLFLAAGAVMHVMNDVLDMRRLGGLRHVMPLTFWTFLIGALALAGFPLLSGFFSKDTILASGFAAGSYLLWLVALLTAALTAFYIFRAVILTFGGSARWKGQTVQVEQHGHVVERAFHPHEPSWVMTLPLILLALLSIGGGYIGLPQVIAENRFAAFLEPVLKETPHHLDPTLEWILLAVSSLAGILGILFALWFFVRNTTIPARLRAYYPWLYTLLANKYWVDEIYDALFARPGRWLANAFWLEVDGKVINGAADGLGRALRDFGRALRALQAGYARGYALAMLIGIVVVIAVVMARM